jgi:hypothetical protein
MGGAICFRADRAAFFIGSSQSCGILRLAMLDAEPSCPHGDDTLDHCALGRHAEDSKALNAVRPLMHAVPMR